MDPLGLDDATMRRYGHAVVDMLVDELLDGSAPVLRRATPAEMELRLGAEPPEAGEEFGALLEHLRRDVLPFAGRPAHPGFFAFVPGCPTWPGVLGDLIAGALNIHAGNWMTAAGPSRLEIEVLGWFKRWLGLPPDAGGLLVSGGSAANLTALACAREHKVGAMRDDLVVYVADQAHSSIARAARVLGFRPEQTRVLPVDADFRLIPRLVAGAIDADVRAGRTPLLVAASAGSTNTGAVDPLAEIAGLCRDRGVWLHVDAAYGGFAVLTERGRAQLGGLDAADSITLDPHKWLYQPYECGCLLVRDPHALAAAFTMTPEYLRDARAESGEVNFADLGIQLTRSARALKLWLSLRTFGVAAFREAIDRALTLAERVQERVEASTALELAAPPALGVVCFRRRYAAPDAAVDALNARLVAALEATGEALVSSTRLRGRYAIRMCVLNHTSEAADVDRVIDFLETATVRLSDAAPEPGTEWHPDVTDSWLAELPSVVAGRHPDPVALRRLKLFAALTPAQAATAATLAVRREAAAGEQLIEQWAISRDFFVLLSGEAEVLVDGRPVRALGPGDVFGELAALEWARGFGYPRLAAVIATEPSELLVFPDGALNVLMRRLPSVRDQITTVVQERLPQA